MNILKLNPVTTSAAICALSLVLSAAAFAAGGMRTGGSVNPNSSMRTTASTHVTATTRSMPTKPVAPATRTKTTAHTTGQPNASCEDTPNPPGNSASAPGSAFNPDGNAGTHYAGEQPQNSKNPNSVSQYDQACARNHSH
jgi:hypothetical protein